MLPPGVAGCAGMLIMAAAGELIACACAPAATAPAERSAPAALEPLAVEPRCRLATGGFLPGLEDAARRFLPRGVALAPADVPPMAVLSALLVAPLGPAAAAAGGTAGCRRTVTVRVFGAVTAN